MYHNTFVQLLKCILGPIEEQTEQRTFDAQGSLGGSPSFCAHRHLRHRHHHLRHGHRRHLQWPYYKLAKLRR